MNIQGIARDAGTVADIMFLNRICSTTICNGLKMWVEECRELRLLSFFALVLSWKEMTVKFTIDALNFAGIGLGRMKIVDLDGLKP